ncbi:hypothetical protein GA0115245_105030 [Streptomyces sp. di188]|nr:hypothetical protein GA0115245_105030 [Streptomyces sp. di188]SCD48578.1 hypothetical protein GA0115238_11155 [Streptomyces sp. di50b]
MPSRHLPVSGATADETRVPERSGRAGPTEGVRLATCAVAGCRGLVSSSVGGA